jgi:hypothetical protein
MWKKIGCVELTGSRAQLRWNHLKHGEKVDEDSIPSEENPRFHSYIVGSDRTGQTVVSLSIRTPLLCVLSPNLCRTGYTTDSTVNR